MQWLAGGTSQHIMTIDVMCYVSRLSNSEACGRVYGRLYYSLLHASPLFSPKLIDSLHLQPRCQKK